MTAPVVILQQFHASVSQICSLQNFKQNLYDQEGRYLPILRRYALQVSSVTLLAETAK